MLTPKGLDKVKEYANAIGPYKEFYTVGTKVLLEKEIKSRKHPFPILDSSSPRIKKLGGFIGPDLLSLEAKKRGLEQIVYTFYSSYEPSGSVST